MLQLYSFSLCVSSYIIVDASGCIKRLNCPKHMQEALEMKKAELSAIRVTCGKKDEQIRHLEQSLSQMSTDKKEFGAKLRQTEEKLKQTNSELLTYKEEVQKLNKRQVISSNYLCYSWLFMFTV